MKELLVDWLVCVLSFLPLLLFVGRNRYWSNTVRNLAVGFLVLGFLNMPLHPYAHVFGYTNLYYLSMGIMVLNLIIGCVLLLMSRARSGAAV